MKTLLLAFVAAAGLGNIVAVSGAAEPTIPAQAPPPVGQISAGRPGLITGTTALIGTKVRDSGDSSVGKLEDVILDLATGEAVAAVFSGASDTQVTPVPARSFRIATRNKIMVNADKKTLKGAPCLPKADLSQAPELGSLSRSFTYFDQEASKMSAAGKLSSATRLVHQELRSQDNEPLGLVEDIVVNLPAGRALYLLIKPTTAAEVQKALYAVQPQSVQPDATGHALVLRASQAHFLAGPHFQQEYRTELCSPEFAVAVRRHYAQQEAPAAPHPAPPAQASASSEASAANSQPAPIRSDEEITQAVVTEIVRNDSYFSIRDLKITTSNGRVTLASRVKNEKQRQQLVAAAARVVGTENVENQLQTRANN